MELLIEYFGTAASVVVAVSLTQRNIKRLRIINGIGSLCFAFYGAMIQAWPVMGLNAFIVVIDFYYLVMMKRSSSYFEILKIEKPDDSAYIKSFLDFYGKDISLFMPGFGMSMLAEAQAVLVLRDMLPVSIILFRETEDEIEILVDYAIPAYRDMKNSSYFFQRSAQYIESAGVKPFTAPPGSRTHNRYLVKMGFQADSDGKYRCERYGKQ